MNSFGGNTAIRLADRSIERTCKLALDQPAFLLSRSRFNRARKENSSFFLRFSLSSLRPVLSRRRNRVGRGRLLWTLASPYAVARAIRCRLPSLESRRRWRWPLAARKFPTDKNPKCILPPTSRWRTHAPHNQWFNAWLGSARLGSARDPFLNPFVIHIFSTCIL